MKREIHCVLCLGVALALAAGCNTSGRAKESERVFSSMEKVYAELGKGSQEIQRTTALLEQLQQGTNLKETFQQYTAAVADLKAAGDHARERAQAMRDNREEYLAKWQHEAENIKNPQIKEETQARRERVRANFQKITTMADDVRAAYQPFLSDVQGIQKALSLDLTPAGVKALQPSMAQAKTNGELLNQKLDALGKELNSLLGRMSPTGAK